MIPKHIKKVDDNRKAAAPYNFVELPDLIVEAKELPSGDRYYPNENVELPRHTGRIECTLTTSSPLYTRCGMTLPDFEKYSEFREPCPELPKGATDKQKKRWEEQKKEWEERKKIWEKERKEVLAPFFHALVKSEDGKLLPVLPGSSLRGMLRNLVEIVSFSKIERVSGHKRLFFRAVASNKDKESWGREYKTYVNPQNIQAGYLKKDNQDWYIQPAKTESSATFAWIRESSLNLIDLKKFNDKKYIPQYIAVSYRAVARDTSDKAGRLFAHDVELPGVHSKEGILVTSGNMKQGDESSPRRNHCVVFAKDESAELLLINEKAIEHYCNALTDFQKASPFDKDLGILEEDRPIFYLPPKTGSNIVGFFGQSPNFRIPYSPQGNGHATTVLDFIPKNLREISSIDLADAIFGWVKEESEEDKLPKGFDKQRAGRVFFTDALYQSDQEGKWYEDKPLIPQILSEPKSTYFPHYLVQPEKDNPTADPLKLKHYASQGATVIRGHKLYWHKGSNPNFKITPPKKVIDASKKVIDAPKKVSDTQTTLIKPLKKGVTFKFHIYFENLSEVELGVLLWVLDIAQDNRYRLSLGMGKPLGMGAVKIAPKLYLSVRTERYTQLFNGNNDKWKIGEHEKSLLDCLKYRSTFEKYTLSQLQQEGLYQDIQDFKKIPRIQMLLAMLRWEENLSSEQIEQRQYMELDSFKNRKVLPTPLQQSSQQFLEGQVVKARVVDIKEEEIPKGKKQQLKTTITYEIEGSDCPSTEEVNKQKVSLAIGDIVKVSIVKVQGISIRKVKRVAYI